MVSATVTMAQKGISRSAQLEGTGTDGLGGGGAAIVTAWEKAGGSEAYSLWADVAVGMKPGGRSGAWGASVSRSGRDEVAVGQAGILRLGHANKGNSWCGMPTKNESRGQQGNVSQSPFPQAHCTHAPSILWVPVVM